MMAMFAGSRMLQVNDELNRLSFPLWVLYPTRTPSAPVAFGPYVSDVSVDAPLEPGVFPLVAISHGSKGSPFLYRTLAAHLAKNGYIVALPEHPHDNRNNSDGFGTLDNLVNRPRHIRLAIDALVNDPIFKNGLQADKTALVGHSMGGYTALALAGGRPWVDENQPVAVAADGRVKALVLLAPAAGWYMPEGSLRQVAVPILLLTAELDRVTPSWNGEIVLAGAAESAPITHRVVPNAGHYSFLAPFPAALKRPDFPPSNDPPGFDRDQFHQQLNSELLAFLDSTLKPVA